MTPAPSGIFKQAARAAPPVSQSPHKTPQLGRRGTCGGINTRNGREHAARIPLPVHPTHSQPFPARERALPTPRPPEAGAKEAPSERIGFYNRLASPVRSLLKGIAMPLASQFSRSVTMFRSHLPLSDERMREVAPSIFAQDKHASRSERYTYIPTIEVLRGLRQEGFFPFMGARPVAATNTNACTAST